MKRRNIAILLTLVLTLSLSACGGAAPGNSASGGTAYYGTADSVAAAEEDAYYWDAEMPMETASKNGDTVNSTRANVPESVKMIYRANLELETTEYEKAQSDIVTLTNQLGGYFEEQSSNNYSSGYRSASYTVRVPAAQFDTFLHQIGELCRVRYQTQSAENVSERYYDMESRLETAKIKLDRLQELLSRAEVMEDIITLESAISDTEYQIESLSGELRHYDALIDYSTIYVTLQEVYKVSEQDSAPLTFGQRIGRAFRDGLRDFGDFLEDAAEMLAYSWLTLLVIAAAAVLIVKLILRKKGKLFARKKKNAPAETTEEKQE
ncbi:MAG: DUF4349 domain-containing protein [Oscillospiraceae bacterium]|nr:DUF4349 domain-containing protein [Oscillospiraceae bacterium]